MRQSDPIVSIVVCFLDEERFLAEAVDSVRAQTFSDWELLLVDDGSSDGSEAVAQRFATQDPSRVIYIDHAQHRNLGLSASRNTGIDRARGRYVALLDADDVWCSRKLEQQVAILERNPQVAMVVGASEYWRSWSGEGVDEIIKVGTASHDGVIEPPQMALDLYPLGPGAAPPPSDLLVRREAALAVGGFEASFRGPLMLYEDQAFLSKIYRRYPVYVASTCWDRYRKRPGSIMNANTDNYWRVRAHFLAWLHEDLARSGDGGHGVREALARSRLQARRHLLRQRVATVARRVFPAPLVSRFGRLWPK